MSNINKDEIKKLLELIAKAYEKAGRKMTSATMITDVNEDGTLEAEELIKASSAGGFENTVVSYMDSYGTLICKHPAAVAVIHNFTLA